jgi:glycerol-3-phosphate dehydrogenase
LNHNSYTHIMKASFDIIIIGAGIAGLYTANVLQNEGYSVALLQQGDVGAGQTVLSQGIIHGGTKYALAGKAQGDALSVAAMTHAWAGNLQGTGDIDLRGVRVASQHHYLCSLGGFSAGLKNVVASKVLSSSNTVLKRQAYPEFFQAKAFKGSLCELDEVVLDVPSVLAELAKPLQHVYAVDAVEMLHEDESIVGARMTRGEHTTTLTAGYTVLCAGGGNQGLLAQLGMSTPKMQRRPLHMAWAKGKLPEVFVHVVDKGVRPFMTVTSHICADGDVVWYLGGDIAEGGVVRNEWEQVAEVKKVLSKTFPQLPSSSGLTRGSIQNYHYGTVRIDRAEATMPGGKKPDDVTLFEVGNGCVGWPTKLTLAPKFAHQVLGWVTVAGVEKTQAERLKWPRPQVAAMPWE